MVTGLGAGFDRALLFLLEKIDQLSDRCLFNSKLFLAGV